MTEKEAVWQGGAQGQNVKMKTKGKTEKYSSGPEEEERTKDEEIGGRKALCYHISIITSSSLYQIEQIEGTTVHRRARERRH